MCFFGAKICAVRAFVASFSLSVHYPLGGAAGNDASGGTSAHGRIRRRGYPGVRPFSGM